MEHKMRERSAIAGWRTFNSCLVRRQERALASAVSVLEDRARKLEGQAAMLRSMAADVSNRKTCDLGRNTVPKEDTSREGLARIIGPDPR